MPPFDRSSVIRIATRSSALALWQAQHVRDLLAAARPEAEVELVEVSTIGDRDRRQPLSEMGGIGVFTREVQHAVLEGHADLAVHSLKDLPTDSHPDLTLAAVPERAPRFDVLVFPAEHTSLEVDELPEGCRIGTGSLRRRAQLLHVRDDLQMLDIRGNVPTRLRKLDEGEYDAIVLAEAGLQRLGLDRVSTLLTPPLMYPAVGQAALGIECRSADAGLRETLSLISEPTALSEVTAERACLATLRGGCHAPVGVLTEINGDRLAITAVVLSADGSQRLIEQIEGAVADAAELGEKVAEQLRAAGAAALIDV